MVSITADLVSLNRSYECIRPAENLSTSGTILVVAAFEEGGWMTPGFSGLLVFSRDTQVRPNVALLLVSGESPCFAISPLGATSSGSDDSMNILRST